MSEDGDCPLSKCRRRSMTESLSGGGGDNASLCKYVDLPVFRSGDGWNL